MDRDAILEITIADDRMSVEGTFYPAIHDGRILSPEYVGSVLENAGVIAGIDDEKIAEAIFTCNTERRSVESVVIAVGTSPIAERPGYWEIRSPSEHDNRAPSADDQIDYKGITHLDVVHAGDVVAGFIEPREGVAGIDVLGNEIGFSSESVPTYQPGERIVVKDDSAIAEVGGQIVVTKGQFSVVDRLEITGDIGYATGSIEFPGDVVVRGEIKEGFHIWAGKSVTADRTVDVSEIYCRGAFQSTGGIIGRGKALLRAVGPVHIRFAGNCFVESKEAITVIQYAYNSRIACLGAFTMEKSGRVIGGVVTAQDGVHCRTLGNTAGVPTTIRVGTDFIVERKLRLNREKYQDITLRLQRLTTKMGENPTDRQLDIIRRLEETRNKHVQALGELTEALDKNESAQVIATGDVYPGVNIHICRAQYTVTEKLHGVVFRLDKASGRVVVLSIKELEGGENESGTPQTTETPDSAGNAEPD